MNNIIRAKDLPVRTSLKRSDLLNSIAEEIGAKSYLEIGVQEGITFNAISISKKTGVDPDPYSKATLHITSDMYFDLLDDDVKFDLIYVDGLHHWETALRDIDNAVKHLSKDGVIVVDDIAPRREEHQTREPSAIYWTGDVWKAWFVAIHRYGSQFDMFGVDIALGQGVIRSKRYTPVESEQIDNKEITGDLLSWGHYIEGHHRYHRMLSWENYTDQDWQE